MSERLFLALWPEEGVRTALRAACANFGFQGGRAIPPENWHVTLVFLGNVEAEQRRRIEGVLAQGRSAPFEFLLTEIAWRRHTGIVWATAEETPSLLLDLITELQTALATCGHKAESRPFRLHVTLARDVSRAPQRQTITPIQWTAREISLISSRPTATGSAYAVERRWPLS